MRSSQVDTIAGTARDTEGVMGLAGAVTMTVAVDTAKARQETVDGQIGKRTPSITLSESPTARVDEDDTVTTTALDEVHKQVDCAAPLKANKRSQLKWSKYPPIAPLPWFVNESNVTYN